MQANVEQASAVELVNGLANGEISSRDLLEHYIARINAQNPEINAVIAFDLEKARRQADEADRLMSRGESNGRLHGLPMTIKDTYEVPGMSCTAGDPAFRDHQPMQHAVAVQRLVDEGAIIFGKSNVPFKAADIQTYNAIYGTTRNPRNGELTPGGSSGGAAAALATGMTPLELGSDIGGSIRIPAHFCGVFGHKPTHGIISLRGHIPGMPGDISEPDMAVAGPMARTATDLRMMLDVVAGPTPAMQPGWQLTLPECEKESLNQFRVLLWTDDPSCPIDREMQAVYTDLKAQLEAAGAHVVTGTPAGLDLATSYGLYAKQLSSKMMAWSPRVQRSAMRRSAPLVKQLSKIADMPSHADCFYSGAGISHADWLGVVEESARLRENFLPVFEQFDVVLAPPTFTTAFPHDHSRFMGMRQLQVDGVTRHYADLFMWIAPATLMGLPSTSAPVGETSQGLPVNIQIMGAPYADKSTIKFAELLSLL